MRYQSVCVLYYSSRLNEDEIEIALLRGDYTDLPEDVKLGAMMPREKLLALFAAARWEVIEADNGEMIVFGRITNEDGSRTFWPSKRLEGKRRIIKPTLTHYLDMQRPSPLTVLKMNYATFDAMQDSEPVAVPPAPYATLATYYPHSYEFSVWHSERVEVDMEQMLITDYGWWEVFISYIWTTSQTPPDDR